MQHAETKALGLFQKVIYHQTSISLRLDHSNRLSQRHHKVLSKCHIPALRLGVIQSRISHMLKGHRAHRKLLICFPPKRKKPIRSFLASRQYCDAPPIWSFQKHNLWKISNAGPDTHRQKNNPLQSFTLNISSLFDLTSIRWNMLENTESNCGCYLREASF